MAKRGKTVRKPAVARKAPTTRKRASVGVDIGKENSSLRRELAEGLERQAATAEILNVISNSPTDTQPVFEAIVQSGLKLFPGALVSVALRYGETINAAAVAAPDPARVEAWRRTISRTPLARNFMHGAALLDRRIVDIPDVADAPAEFAAGSQNFLTSGNHAITIMPMMRGDEAIGLLSVVRLVPGPLSDKQIAVLKTFASQAVIAIENARLLRELRASTEELRESLQQQTATSDVLKVISHSTFDLQKILDTLTQSACRLCDAFDAIIYLPEGELLVRRAHYGPIPVSITEWPLSRTWTAGRAVVDRKPVHVHDMQAEQIEFPDGHMRARQLGHRTILSVPLLRGEEAIGCLTIRRSEVRPFTAKQIELAETFADQAVIAIENVRMFDEVQARTRDLAESLEQQTATSEVLQVISASPGELEPVFQKLLENATRVCGASSAQ